MRTLNSAHYVDELYDNHTCEGITCNPYVADAVTVAAGESMVIPRGFSGTWEVVEPTRKTFVIYEPGPENSR